MKILIVDDHPLVRKGLASTLSLGEEVHLIVEAENLEEALRLLDIEKPDIAIIDLKLKNNSGLEIIAEAKRKKYLTKYVILTSSIEKEEFLKAKEMDVDGYILKDAYIEDIMYALRVIKRGNKFYDSQLIQYHNARVETDYGERLTPRERDVLIELGKGLSNTQIAKKLYISENTVKKHVSNILSKLCLTHRTQAALFVNKSAQI